ncbi:S-4TM family putative pore-forming effector [Pseudonocardia bannensis]|uniref:Uncharacterized protein n=1 Tax=Pseudonocardia bannensis TaxID=630973 RepID=A0A848DFD7_9PSEU|nr:S-4TM family putative pore-forming effector [Pseudonocardia bannensis]NMH91274.1 hypothetical protein [Pseudonocardia bannensis]
MVILLNGRPLPEPTAPPIFEAENTQDARRLVAAQARMYSDAKRLFYGRIVAVFALSVAAMATSAVWPDSRVLIGGGGGLLLFGGSFIIESIEKRQRLQAAATQELFDTRIFQIEWNSLYAARPPAIAIAKAAKCYRGGRDANWYEDTAGTHRPFDVLICQATNLGWGATMHRLWAWLLVGMFAVAVAVLGAAWVVLRLPPDAALLTLFVPFLAPAKELANLIRSNFDASSTKESAERTLSEVWEKGMFENIVPDESKLRSIQDKILTLRQANAYVPDWLDSIFHKRNEAVMRASVADRVLQAKRHGYG